MGLCFRKSITICKGIKINLSKSGPSLSFGKRGLRGTIHRDGRLSTSVGIPGTGLYYRKNYSGISALGKKENGVRYPEDNGSVSTASEENRKEVEAYNELVESVKSIHKECDEYVDWQKIAVSVPSGEEEQNLKKLADGVLKGDIDSYLLVINEMKPFDDLLEYGSDFEAGTGDSDIMEIEFHVKSDDVIPDYVETMTASGKLARKAMTKSQRNELIQDYICSCTIRIARDVFALLPVKTVVVHAEDSILNTATGYTNDETVLSAAVDRERLGTLNFERIDPSDALSAFRCNMKFKKTEGMEPVERLSVQQKQVIDKK